MEDNINISKYMPPRAIDSITSGFQIATRHIYLLIFPIFIDLFLWFGPKLRVKDLFLGVFQNFLTTWSTYLDSATNTLLADDFRQSLVLFLESFNLFSVANTFPVGIPSLLRSVNTISSPLGDAQIHEIGTLWNLLGIWLAISTIGIVLGTFYFREISLITKETIPHSEIHEQSTFFKQFINSSIFMGLLLIGTAIVSTMSILFISLITLISAGIAQLALLTGFAIATWLALPLMFGAHGIFLFNQPFYKSIFSGYKVMSLSFRYRVSQKEALFTLPKSVTFVFLVYILYEGLNLVWKIPDSASFFMIIGIFGHGLISTALVISSFHYFSQLKDWQDNLATAQQQLSVFN